jgi:3-deoxy-D-manno-octulosonic-acid transferase
LVIGTALELEKTFNDLLTDTHTYNTSCEAARNYVFNNKGATGKVMQYVQENRLLTS